MNYFIFENSDLIFNNIKLFVSLIYDLKQLVDLLLVDFRISLQTTHYFYDWILYEFLFTLDILNLLNTNSKLYSELFLIDWKYFI